MTKFHDTHENYDPQERNFVIEESPKGGRKPPKVRPTSIVWLLFTERNGLTPQYADPTPRKLEKAIGLGENYFQRTCHKVTDIRKTPSSP